MNSFALSVIVPCFNEEGGLREFHRRVRAVCTECVGGNFEILMINDGSKDGTWAVMEELAKVDRHVVAVNLSRNFGHQAALTAGFQLARGDRVFVLDADLQDPPELLVPMMNLMDEGCEVVYGQRTNREGETPFKKFSAFLFYRLLEKLTDIPIPKDVGDFRLMSRNAGDILNKMPEHHRFIRGMVSWIGLRQEGVPYERSGRFSGNTKYSISKMIRFSLDAITSFSVRPLRIASYLSAVFVVATILFLIYALVRYYFGKTVEGWTSLAMIILTLGSAQLFVVGVMGEYLGRLYIESKGRPLYLVQEIISTLDHRPEGSRIDPGAKQL